MRSTLARLVQTDFPALRRGKSETLQVNLGYRCNQLCVHCHVNAGPHRTEMMDEGTAQMVVDVLRTGRFTSLDLTGGAPELNPNFHKLVRDTRALGVRVIDRCNLTILSEPGQTDLADFLAQQRVEVTASMPCYAVTNVDRQRGEGVFDRSIAGLQSLNARGYGQDGSDLILNLVYNPQGAVLPPAQGPLEADYKRELWRHFGIRFNHLFVITNMPIQRFGSTLLSKGAFDAYMGLLKSAYRPENLSTVMCKTLVSVDWQGYLYDCDFNQMLGMAALVQSDSKLHASRTHDSSALDSRPHLRDLLRTDLAGAPIRVAEHCYGCTAGQGSSCGGALAA